MLKVSIITPSYNRAHFISDCILSVKNQNYSEIEHIIIDGKSQDHTKKIISDLNHSRLSFISEKDEGAYDAMNKGIKKASGDIVGILNSDDFYMDNEVIKDIAEVFKDNSIDVVFGDLIIVKQNNLNKVSRYYSGKSFQPKDLLSGHMPPHPTIFLRKELYYKIGFFSKEFKTASDLDFLIKLFLKEQVRWTYLPRLMVKMRNGGISHRNIRTVSRLVKEKQSILIKNGFNVSQIKLYWLYVRKVFQFFAHPKLKHRFFL